MIPYSKPGTISDLHTLNIPVLTVWNVIVCIIYYFTKVCKSETSEEVCKQEISLFLMHVICNKVFKDIISMHGIGN